jgi:hypothetical protein
VQLKYVQQHPNLSAQPGQDVVQVLHLPHPCLAVLCPLLFLVLHIDLQTLRAFSRMHVQVGAHPAIAGQTHKFMGIRNGIDTELWSPTENRFLPMPYDADTAEEGKRR